MPKDFTSTTFSEVYKDDYADSNGFHRILFNSGRALQARELTQLQTILQEQIKRFADNVFLDGSAIGASGTGLFSASYVIIDSIPSGYTAKDYIGLTLQGPATAYTSGLQFLVIHAEEANESDSATLYGVYKSINQTSVNEDEQETSPTFSEGDTLLDIRSLSGLPSNPNLEVETQPGGSSLSSTGRGLLFGIQSCHFWTNGFFVFAPEQMIAASKYDGCSNIDVGFEVIKDIVTVEDDESLYDNQGVVPNLSSPGADRFRIRLILTTRSAVTNPNDFIYYASIRNGRVTQVKGGSESYNEIEQRLAVRHFETNGNFEVVPFEIRHLPGESDGVLNLRVPGMNGQGVVPTAYIDGYRLRHYDDETFLVQKPVSTSGDTAQLINVDYKNYITVPYDSDGKNYLGTLPSNFDLPSQTKLRFANIDGTVIGDARVKHIVSTLQPEGFRIHLYDLKMKRGYSFKDAHTILGDEFICAPPANFSDAYATYEPSVMHVYPDGKTITQSRAISFTNADAQIINSDFVAYSNRDFADDGLNYWMDAFNGQIAAGVSNAQAHAIVQNQVRVAWDLGDGVRVDRSLTFCDRLEGGSGAIPIRKDKNDNAYLVDPEISTTLHKIPGGRIKAVSNVDVTVQRQFTATASSNSIQITTGNNEGFDDLSRWTFINTSQDSQEEVAVGSISLNSSTPQTATITGLDGAADDYTIYAYVEKNSAQPKTKTFTKHSSAISATRINDSGGDRFVFDLYDALRVTDARADSANGRDVRDLLIFDDGQRDNYYAPVTLTPDGLPSDVTTVFAKFDYLNWGVGGDYFSVNSYITNDSFGYSDIPVFRSPKSGKYYDLRNHFDFRPKLDPYAEDMPTNARFEVPRDGDNITYDVEWYNKRIDHLTLGYNQHDFSTELRVNKGPESLNPTPPAKKVNEMPLYKIEYNGNTFDVKDLITTKFKHKRFTMEDVSKLEDRLVDLEETVSLSILEQDVVNLVELNSSGEVRTKTGFFVDDFKHGFVKTASQYEPFWVDDKYEQSQSLYNLPFNKKVLGPRSSREAIQMLFDSDNQYTGRTNATRSDVVRKGDLLYLDYKEVLDSSLVNENISWTDDGNYGDRGWYNVNPFDIFTGSGFLKLSPTSDTWNDHYHTPNKSVNTLPTEGAVVQNEMPSRKPGTELDTFKTTVKSYVYSKPEVMGEDLEVYAIPYARQKEIFGKAQGLKPNTRYWPFFDGISVEQWVVNKTSAEYTTHIKNDDHLKSVSEVDVSITQHPNRTSPSDSVLVADANGDLFFSFWLPNNARVPSPNSNSLGSIEEWELWITAQRKKSRQYDGPLDPRVYDDIGWKFRTGAVEFLLNDISSNETTNSCADGGPQSSARTNFISTGSLLPEEKTVHMTRPIDKKRPVYSQPLGQTFSISGQSGIPGAFITKIDVFVRNAPRSASRGGLDLAIPLQLQIREVENGVPVSYPAGEQFRVYKSANEIYDIVSNISNKEDIDDVLSNPVSFEFPEPIFLQANETYAMILTSECNDYEVFIATDGDLVLGNSDLRVSEKPAVGSLVLSQNGLDWSVHANQHLTYRIHTAKFKNFGTFNLFNEQYNKYYHNTPIMQVTEDDLTRFRVKHYNHGLGVGDKVGLVGLDSTETYLGVSGADIMNSNHTVDSADPAGYYVELASGSFSEAGIFGENTAKSNRAFNFDRATYNVESKEFPTTEIVYEGNFARGISHANIDLTRTSADPRFDINETNTKFASNHEMYYNTPRMLANPNQETDDIGLSTNSEPSSVIGTIFRTNSLSTFGGPKAASFASSGYVSDVSPIIDLQRSVLVMENSIIDNQCGPGFITDQYARYRINQTIYYNAAGLVNGGLSLIDSSAPGAPTIYDSYFYNEVQAGLGNVERHFEQEGINYWMGNHERYIDAGLSFDSVVDKVKGQILVAFEKDEIRRQGVNRIVDDNCTNNNIPKLYMPETNPTEGTSVSKHLTRPVVLTQASNGLRVFIDAFRPPAAKFDLFFRSTSDADEDIYLKEFEKVELQNDPESNPFNPDTFDIENVPFSEYRYLIGGTDGNLPDFTKFQLKIVMRSKNSCEIPLINSIRVAALI